MCPVFFSFIYQDIRVLANQVAISKALKEALQSLLRVVYLSIYKGISEEILPLARHTKTPCPLPGMLLLHLVAI